MKGAKSQEVEADGVPASELWGIYAGLGFVQLFHKLLPRVLRKVGVGTVLQVTLASPGEDPAGGRELTYQEEFVRIDSEKRVKETLAIQGDVLKLGFTKYVTRLEVIEKGPCSSAIRSTLEYEFPDEHPEIEDAASTAPLAAAAESIVQYVKEQKQAS
ncbi:unnamed protein product [Urochloa humidicola]